MNFMKKMERKFGKFAIPNLTTIIIGCYILGELLAAVLKKYPRIFARK